jgi:hypothetical protein
MDAEAEDKPTALTWLEVISKTRGYRNLCGALRRETPGHFMFRRQAFEIDRSRGGTGQSS